jgi:hypothetical protein
MNYAKQLAGLPQPWPTLRLGGRSWFVRLLRRLLSERGYADPGWKEPAVAVSDYYDGELLAPVKAFQKAQGLDADGIVGPKTWAALAGQTVVAAPPLGEPVLVDNAAARSDAARSLVVQYGRLLAALGVREHGGANRGEVVDAFNRHTLGHTGEPWCLTSVDFIVDTACKVLGAARPLDIGASASGLHNRAKPLGRVVTLAKALPGMVFLVPGGPTGWQHGGILESKDGLEQTGKVHTLEGNTNGEGSSEGYEFVKRTRRAAGLVFVDWSR